MSSVFYLPWLEFTLVFGCDSMNEQKSSEIVHVCPENFSLLQYILKKMLHLKESGIQIAL